MVLYMSGIFFLPSSCYIHSSPINTFFTDISSNVFSHLFIFFTTSSVRFFFFFLLPFPCDHVAISLVFWSQPLEIVKVLFLPWGMGKSHWSVLLRNAQTTHTKVRECSPLMIESQLVRVALQQECQNPGLLVDVCTEHSVPCIHGIAMCAQSCVWDAKRDLSKWHLKACRSVSYSAKVKWKSLGSGLALTHLF